MPEPLYFQWQNEILLKTIYPLREMRLRDFLVVYKEIETWAEYKDKNIADQISDYHAKRPIPERGTTPWQYNLSDPIICTRSLIKERGAGARQMEWLRWMHEATVVEMAETSEDTVVLTFETALPSDDPRLSSIGVFRHRLDELLSDRDEDSYYRGFVGYTPEEQVPVDNLNDMLDWDKILYKPPSA